MLDCMQENQQESFTARVDNNAYNEAELISIKTPIDLPYYTNSQEYERAYGSINVHGVDYEYVKRRVYNDTLELLCLPNRAKTEIQSTRDEFVKHALDGNNSAPNKRSTRVAKISLPDFYQELKPSEVVPAFPPAHRYAALHTQFFSSDYSSRQERPPSLYA
jgi:hypothetical protein